jgi:hypothetical protein
MSDLGLTPDDDSFVRAAIQGLRVPGHHPDFWDQLAWQLDDAADEMASEGLLQRAPEVPLIEPELAEPEPSPHHVEDPWTDSEAAAAAAHAAAVAGHGHEALDVYGPAAEPVYEDDDEELAVAAATRPQPRATAPRTPDHPARREPLRAGSPRVFVEAPVAAFAPAPRVRHDAAVVPASLRRASNAVLLAVVVVAAVVAVMAGLALVRQRSNSGAPAPTEVPHGMAEAPSGPGLGIVS